MTLRWFAKHLTDRDDAQSRVRMCANKVVAGVRCSSLAHTDCPQDPPQFTAAHQIQQLEGLALARARGRRCNPQTTAGTVAFITESPVGARWTSQSARECEGRQRWVTTRRSSWTMEWRGKTMRLQWGRPTERRREPHLARASICADSWGVASFRCRPG